MKKFEQLDYAICRELEKLFLGQDFTLFEKKIEELELSKNDIVKILEEAIYHETHGFGSYLTPRILPIHFEYVQNKYLPKLAKERLLAFEALRLTNDDVIKWFLDNGFEINTQDEKGNTLLHIAAALRYTSAHSFNATDYDVPKPWELPNNDDPQKMKLLLNYEPDISIKNHAGLTPLDVAKNYDNYRVLKLLEDFNHN